MVSHQLTLPGEVVKKDNTLIRSKIEIDNVQSSKVLTCFIACINKADKQFKDSYRIAVKDILSHLGGENYTRIKNICSELRKSGVCFEFLDDSGDPIYITVSFFSRVEYKKGIIEAKFNYQDDLIYNCLLGLKEKFTEYNLIEYLKLSSVYSQRLFEILKSWSNAGETTIKVTKLHHMLNTPASFRSDFRQFRIYVLEKAHKDIQEKTSLRYDWAPIKKGRAVESIRFCFGSRRAIVQQKQEDQEKKSRLNTQRFTSAVNCSKSKSGNCTHQDNKPIICKMCMEFNICAEIRRKQSN